MSNISSYESEQTINPDIVDRILAHINAEKFGGLLQIKSLRQNWGWNIVVGNLSMDIWRMNGTRLEWKSDIDCLASWTLNTITARLIRDLDPNGFILDEGLGADQIKPDFDQKFPKPSDWMKALFGQSTLVQAYSASFADLMNVVENAA